MPKTMHYLKTAFGAVFGLWMIAGLFLSPVLWLCSSAAKRENRRKWLLAGFLNAFAWCAALVLIRVLAVKSARA